MAERAPAADSATASSIAPALNAPLFESALAGRTDVRSAPTTATRTGRTSIQRALPDRTPGRRTRPDGKTVRRPLIKHLIADPRLAGIERLSIQCVLIERTAVGRPTLIQCSDVRPALIKSVERLFVRGQLVNLETVEGAFAQHTLINRTIARLTLDPHPLTECTTVQRAAVP